MKLNRVNSSIDRNERNKINENFDIIEGGFGKTALDARYAVETSDEAKQKAESVQTQFNQVVIEGDSSVEAAQARVDLEDVAHETLKVRIDNDVTKINQKIDGEIDVVTRQLAQTDVKVDDIGINIATAVVADGVTDDSLLLQALIDANPNSYFIAPKRTYVIRNSIRIPNFTKVEFNRGAKVIIDADVDGFILSGSESELINAEIEVIANYTKSAVIMTATGGHVWNQRLEGFRAVGSTYTGNAVKVLFASFGSMMPQINKFLIRGFENAILFDSTDSNFWVNGGVVKDGWIHMCKNHINFVNNALPNRWKFDNVKGQRNAGITEYTIKNVQGSLNHFTDCMAWDGFSMLIGTKATGTIVEGNTVISQDNITDLGYRTNLLNILQPNSTDGKFAEAHDNFIGYELSNLWRTTITSTGSITLGIDATVPQTQSVILSTGTTSGSTAVIDFGNVAQFSRYNHIVSSFKFRLSDISNSSIKVGLKTLSENYHSYIVASDGQFMISINGTLHPTGVNLNTTYHVAQFIFLSESRVLVHFDGSLVYDASTAVPIYAKEPIIEISNSEDVNKQLFVSDFYIRTSIRN